jgi:hypothetical protein
VLIRDNAFSSPHQGAGRGIWITNARRVRVRDNVIRAGWRNNITLEGGDGGDMHDIWIENNELRRAGEWNTSTGLYGDAIFMQPLASSDTSIRNVYITDNEIIDPRRHGIRIACVASTREVRNVHIERNHMTVDRAQTHYEQVGGFVACDTGAGNQVGSISEIYLADNVSEHCFGEAVQFSRPNVSGVYVRRDEHYDCGTTAVPVIGMHFEDVSTLVVEDTIVADRTAESRISYGAAFYDLLVSARITGNDWSDTNSGDIVKTGAAPPEYENSGNLGAASLWP